MFSQEADGKTLRLPTLPYSTNAYGFARRRGAPAIPGADTREILREAGYTEAVIEELVNDGAIGEPS